MSSPQAAQVASRRWIWIVGVIAGSVLLAMFAWGAWRLSQGPAGGKAPAKTARWAPIQAALDRGDWNSVERRLPDWLSENPDHGQGWLTAAALNVARGKPSEALEPLKKVRNEDPSWVYALGMTGELELQLGDAAEAERAFREMAAADPSAIPARKRLVYLYSLELRTAEARSVLWEIYRARPDPSVLAELVDALFLIENDVRGFGPDLERFLRMTPDDPWLRHAKGLSLHWRGQDAEALTYLESASTALENDLTGRFALAECVRRLGRAESIPKSPPAPEKVLGRRPERPRAVAAAWSVLAGRLAEGAHDEADALRFYHEAVATHPESRESLFRLGQILTRTGKAKEGRECLDRAEAIRLRHRALQNALADARGEGFNATNCERLGTLCLEAGMPAEARAWFEMALRYDPELASATKALEPLTKVGPLEELPFALASPVRREVEAVATPVPVVAESQVPASILFEEGAAAAGLDFVYDSGANGDHFVVDTMGGGVGLIDFDEDGYLDIYLVNGCRLPIDPNHPPRPNRLYRNKGDRTFEDVTARANVAGFGYGMGCTVADYDNDGHDDLFVTGYRHTILYRNKGDGTFEDVTSKAGVASGRWTTASGFGDLDGDGDLDLVVVSYVEADPATAPPCVDQSGHPIHCSPGRFPDQFDQIFRNNGDGTFADVSREAGIELPRGRGLGLAIADFDDDAKLDLFIANDATPNYLFRNLGGLKFEETGLSSGVACDGSGQATASMGVVADDLDGDGRIDLYHTNFLNEPNTLRLNAGGGLFVDSTLAAGLDAPSRATTGFGAASLDVDNDGRLDLFVVNGHVDDQPWVNSPMAQPAQLYWNRGQGQFLLAGSAASPFLASPKVGRGLALGDLDNDGRLDLVAVLRDAPVALLWNRSANPGHWLKINLRGTRSGKFPVGTRVVCEAGGTKSTRWLTSGTGYLSSHAQTLHFGLAGAAKVDRLEIHWPSGKSQSWNSLDADRAYLVEEGAEPRALNRP
ncbi:FG-GAP-like repeat-containing protein [Singulisphaera sp. PoT]|uniref:FG-GAP-like repeat-containing protein n=1 Tax=Singulisphaera sp. PoT TaxID=3411797 RepID=UPI003BF52DBF